uniref:Uncharacterized protein n=1 Tax=Arundo donax TaxID=35708 RepID=A0A0A9FWU3_ARUDO
MQRRSSDPHIHSSYLATVLP